MNVSPEKLISLPSGKAEIASKSSSRVTVGILPFVMPGLLGRRSEWDQNDSTGGPGTYLLSG